jgi:hypothetical protein
MADNYYGAGYRQNIANAVEDQEKGTLPFYYRRAIKGSVPFLPTNDRLTILY